ncbi:MAG: zinc-binding dehydrogenase [Dehalococcoidia bacterium]|nr:zinc-binding dehydrogenase [Dehalococcoidia bacterium]
MKAAVYYETGGPEVFRYEDLPDPTCHPRGILVRVEAVSIEGGDVLSRAGGVLATTPHVVGYQAAGTIVEVGEQVTDRQEGQRVVTTAPFGSHAELRSVPVSSSWVIPDGLATEDAATVPVPFGTADDCLFEFGRLQAGETVLIQGAGGGVGVAAVQLAKRAGATVIGAASQDEKLEALRAYGLDHGVNYRTADLVSSVMSLTEGRGCDLVVDPVGGNVLQGSLACLAYRGRAITVGNASRESRLVDLGGLGQGNQSITGVYLGAELARGSRAYDMIAGHLRDMAAGSLRAVIDRRFPLAEAEEAHRYIESRQAFGRVLLIP